MNTYWSQYVQKTEELYLSRALKFHQGNIDKWIDIMRLRDGMKILEVGCAGGLLCHRLKERLSNADIIGLSRYPFFRFNTSVINIHNNYFTVRFQHPVLFTHKFCRITKIHHSMGINQTLIDMVNRRYDKKILQYKNGDKKWEFRIATTVLITPRHKITLKF